MASRPNLGTSRNSKGNADSMHSPGNGRLRVRSALFPMIFICAVVAIPSIIALGWSPNHPLAISLTLYAVVGVTLGAFIYLLLMDPDRLQTKVYLQDRPTLDVHDGETPQAE